MTNKKQAVLTFVISCRNSFILFFSIKVFCQKTLTRRVEKQDKTDRKVDHLTTRDGDEGQFDHISNESHEPPKLKDQRF